MHEATFTELRDTAAGLDQLNRWKCQILLNTSGATHVHLPRPAFTPFTRPRLPVPVYLYPFSLSSRFSNQRATS
jgi:hypothetical protein